MRKREIKITLKIILMLYKISKLHLLFLWKQIILFLVMNLMNFNNLKFYLFRKFFFFNFLNKNSFSWAFWFAKVGCLDNKRWELAFSSDGKRIKSKLSSSNINMKIGQTTNQPNFGIEWKMIDWEINIIKQKCSKLYPSS